MIAAPLKVRGARENNLRGVDLDLPLGALVVFTGVSGSGKSSLAFDTLHQEGQRRYLEALSLQRRGPPLQLRRPDVDTVLGLPPTVALEQNVPSPSRRATVATFTEIHPLLRVIFARAGTQHCPSCGQVVRPQGHDEIVAAILSLGEGTRVLLEAPVRRGGASGAGVLDQIARAGFSRVRLGDEVRRIEEVTARDAEAPLRVVVDRLRVTSDKRDRLNDAVRTTAKAGAGVVVAVTEDGERIFVDRPYCWRCDRILPLLEPRLFSFESPVGRCPVCEGLGVDASTGEVCVGCAGTRLREEARAVRWQGESLPALVALTVTELRARPLHRDAVTETALDELDRRLAVLQDLGLGALALDRAVAEVASGELQRLRLAGQLGARLAGVLYVLDEPTAGLHDDEVRAVLAVISALRAAGNTVLVVEHHPLVVAAADRVVDFGPGPGSHGGAVVYQGDPGGLMEAETPTGRWLSGREHLPAPPPRKDAGVVKVRGASWRSLCDLDVDLAVGAVVAITGRSGSGKTALLETLQHHVHAALGGSPPLLPPVARLDGIERFQRLVVVDRAARGSPRSNPATYTGAWDVVRELLAATTEARVRAMDASFFSLNVKGGRCEVCKGTGLVRVDLGWLPDVWLPCEVCDGRRFAADVLEVRWKGKNPHELLEMRAEDAYAFLAGHPRLESSLRALVDVGLGYLPLGQPGHTLSGGEAQRLRLARELARANRGTAEGTLYLLDDPTTGLHPADIAVLLHLLRRLVAEGATVWLATHHEPLAAACDQVVRLG